MQRAVRARIMSTAETVGGTAVGSVSESGETWETLSLVDFIILGLVSTLQAFTFAICVHLIRWRKWPPYITKNVDLVITSAVSGILWTITKAVANGFARREEGDILAACDFEVSISAPRIVSRW